MRVLKVVQFYFPFQDRGGPVFKVRALARNLGKRGHKITVLTADLGLEKNDHIDASFEPCKWGWRTASDGIETIYLSTVGQYRALTVNPHVLGYARTCLKQFDLVHCYGLYDFLGPTVSYFCRRARIPYVVEPVGMYRPIDRSLRLKRLWHRTLGASFLRDAARIVLTSEIERQELLEGGVSEERLVVRFNGIDNEPGTAPPARGPFRAKWGISTDEPVILFLGRLIPRKNADMLIAAFAIACPASGRLIIAGPEGVYGYRSTLEKLARERGIESRVSFTGALYGDEKLAAMRDADIFVLPSRYENFANAPAEAVACGLPVIVSDACGISALVGGRAGLVVKPELDSLAVALRTLLVDRVLYNNFKKGCWIVAAELSWDGLSQQMETCYTRVLTSAYATI